MFAVGCATRSSVKDKPLDAGTWQEFSAPKAKVSDFALASVKELELDVVEQYSASPSTSVIVAEAGISGWSYGEIVRVAIEELGASRTSVRVVSDAKFKMNYTAPDHSREIISKIAAKLGL
jgi:hypothetical protein